MKIIDKIIPTSTRIIGVLVASLYCSLSWASFDPIVGNKLENLLNDKDIFLSMKDKQGVSGWESARWTFQTDGSLTGYLYTSQYTSTKLPLSVIDNGLWEIKDDNLCINWSTWDDAQMMCYSIFLNGDAYVAKAESGLLKGVFTPQH